MNKNLFFDANLENSPCVNLESFSSEEFFKNVTALNDAQKSAIQAKGRVLVSAGAGTGKTKVLTLRYAYLVQSCKIPLTHIMAVTFTNRAAQEMKGRLEQLMSIQTKSLWIGTFHSLALRLLKSAPERIGRKPGFSVLDTKDQGRIMGKLLKAIKAKRQYTCQTVLHQISQWKCQTWLPHQVPPAHDEINLTLYHHYQQELELTNSVDFDDLLLLSYHMLKADEALLSKWQRYFKHILVDEYQDINSLQYGWIKLLAAQSEGLFCVGDEDQSIYGWRGASIENILRFQEDFPGAQIIPLEENYRSSPAILSAASTLIGNNHLRHGKILRTQRRDGEKIQVQGLWDSKEEAAYVIKKIVASHQKGRPYASMAILMRTSAQSREFEERFLVEHIPYQVVGSINFYERQEIRDMLGYLRWIHNPSDGLAFERVMNTPRRGIGPGALGKIYSKAKAKECSLEEAGRILCEEEKLSSALGILLHQVQKWRRHEGPLEQLAARVFQESGYEAYLLNQGNEGISRQENVKEFLKALENFQNLEDFLDHVSLLLELRARSSQDSVSILTLHAAKGLEFEETFLVGWEEQLFPHARCLSERDLEEERRLAYVALTRAKERVNITFAWNRRTLQGQMPSSPSRFIQELPAGEIDLRLSLEKASASSMKHFPSAPKGVSVSSSQEAIRPGVRLFHQVFGWGIVESYHGNVVQLVFKQYGTKSVMDSFLFFTEQK
ncbi:ATP-dependent helicase [Holospora curviuscula]|uniref:DNA 3'-5' helicase n=1 Tax=Holospora curviuscula TaxID=1082868 RepID=A0A2S5R983_9PROT|nr:UvrD-helicase domain-containing protein [Holospora curviuscula]PPE03860.1 ATP-dependent DNA helicase PcrA [Holospora curviuscula]